MATNRPAMPYEGKTSCYKASIMRSVELQMLHDSVGTQNIICQESFL
jgi:hypothetical protein